MSVDIGIDLGTASVLVYVRGKGVVLKEPSVVAFDRDTNVIKAIGEEARLMLGRTPGNIIAVRPLRQGVISDYTVTEKMIKYFVQKALGKRTFKKPRISICVPSGVTEVEKKAVEEATFAAGAREVHLIEEPVAAAIGAGIDIAKPCGNMIVDIGGGTSDIAVISLGGAVVNTSIKVAGDDFDEAIPAFFAGIFMAICYSISYGIAAGFIFYCITKICKKQAKQIHPILWGATVLFILNFVLLTFI